MFSSIQQREIIKNTSPQPRQLNISPGQIFQGQVKRLFPNHLALLTLGTMNVTARLEVGLTAGLSYWFQVQSDAGIPKLKIIEGHQPNKTSGQVLPQSSAQSLLQALGIDYTKSSDAILRFFVAEQIPFTKELLTNAQTVLSESGLKQQEGLQVLKQLLQQNLPITADIAKAVHQTKTDVPLLNQLQELVTMVQQSSKLNQTQPLLHQLQQVIKELTVKNELPSPVERLQTLLISSNESVREGALSLLQRTGISQNDIPKQRDISVGPSTINASQEAVRIEQANKQILSLAQQPLSKTEQLAFTQMVSDKTLLSNQTGVPAILAQALRMFGFQYENMLSKQLLAEGKPSMATEQLKPLLIQMATQEGDLLLQKKAEALLLRVTGTQLMALDQTSSLPQTVIQIPLQLGSFQTDLTMQWEGKKTEDGQFDENHCRILFYLQLERLDETIVDVQIQKRIVTITIFNDHVRPALLLEGLTPVLKEKLLSMDYKLSTITWKTVDKEVQPIEKNSLSNGVKNPYQARVSYQGVDIKI
ncbi:hypothetical protein [Bacillus alkalicellulosilyticus]|uniref:hypothetical protein n=1 Tax=Alkalihalobacterium alkalicellulosilyticum TaxID=1912214 RepID=UPI000995EBF8|nr:hypothetical protein [Bacillus alkalicellulosilyticus]